MTVVMSEKNPSVRPVRIESANGVWFVVYTDRQARQRRSAAQFDGKDTTRGQVVKWVRSQPSLKLAR